MLGENIMNEKSNSKSFFVGCFQGVKNNNPYYFLCFAYPQKQQAYQPKEKGLTEVVGGGVASIYVEKDVYDLFKAKCKPFEYVDACVMYVNGGPALISYNL